MRTCSVDDCERPHDSRGLCGMHAQRARRGKPLDMDSRLGKTEAERFWAKVNRSGGFPNFDDPLVRVGQVDGECWLWTASTDPAGYGRFGLSIPGRIVMAHRWSKSDEGGEIPENRDVDHLCRRRNCVRPSHLEVVSGKVNRLRGDGIMARHARQRECIHGHEFTPENTRVRLRGNSTHRECLTCKRDRRRPSRRDLATLAA